MRYFRFLKEDNMIERIDMYPKLKLVHLTGIGGVGMSGIAEVLHVSGYCVTGSDIKESDTVKRLRSLGIPVFIGHRPENIGDADVVVYSSAVKIDNPELRAARERSIPVIPRAEMLAELMRMKRGILVAGSHGKTTGTSMISFVLSAGGLDPTIIIGGKLDSIGSGARKGGGEFLVAETDESDRTFLLLSPTIAVVTNIDPEHMESYRDMDDVKSAYLNFINKVPFYGLAVLCMDNENIQSIIPEVQRRFVTYGFSPQADFTAIPLELRESSSSFRVFHKGRDLGEFRISMPGRHNICNSLAAVAVGVELDIDPDKIRSGLQCFGGIHRRFEVKGEVNGIMVVDDYAHHPSEIKATIEAAREGWKGRRIVAIFQPHRWTRLKSLFNLFVPSFNMVDILIVTDIYSAGESVIEGVSAEMLALAIRKHGHREVYYIHDKEEIPGFLMGRVKEGDMLIFMGAGDIYQVAEKMVTTLKDKGSQKNESEV